MRWKSYVAAVLSLFLLTGCATTRTITITTRPDDALLRVDGIDRGHGPVTEQFTFNNDTDIHRVTASRLGYKDETKEIAMDYTAGTLDLEMKQQTRKINLIFNVAVSVSVDGVPITTEAVTSISRELPFTVDSKGAWTTHTIGAERFGFQPKTQIVSWTDRDPDYVINLERMRKDLSITSIPSGANVYLDEQFVGTTSTAALHDPAVEFFVDPDTNQWATRKLHASKPGYDPVDKLISWDNAKSDYEIDLVPKTKSIRIITDPPGANVTLDGKTLPHDSAGMSYADKLEFPPDDKGQINKTFSCVATKKTGDSEWEPLSFSIAWDDGKTDYAIALKEILTRPVTLLEPVWEYTNNGWEVSPRERTTVAMKSVNEGPNGRNTVLLANAGKDVSIDSLDVSPDGTQVLFTVLSGKDRASFHSRMEIVRTDGTGGTEFVSDGKSLDLTPSFSPGGDQIAFASDRFGRRLSICTMATNGAPGVRKITSGDNNDLWPSIDSEPSPHLFYQSMVDTRPEPRLYESQIGATILSDLTQAGGCSPASARAMMRSSIAA